jgi:hypothetical protein
LPDRELLEDVLIVLGLFGLGAVLFSMLGVAVYWLLEQLGWLETSLSIGREVRDGGSRSAS